MMSFRYPTKKALKESVGTRLRYEETSFFGNEYHGDGTYTGVGPSPYKRVWFATVTIENGVIQKVS